MRLKPSVVAQASSVKLRGKLAQYAESCGWVLCIGAGTSRGVFPCWNDLAKVMLSKTSLKCGKADIERFLQAYGPEALMQVANNLLGENSDETIVECLSEAFYGHLRDRVGDSWRTFAKALTSSRPSNLTKDEWEVFESKVSEIADSSAPLLAQEIAKSISTDAQPAAILSFNAEPLLYALINCYYGLTHPECLRRDGPKILDRLSHDLASRTRGRIPYYYVHGLLPVPSGRDRFNDSISPDKLVFTEGQYLNLSRSSYSWQSATFLSSCIHHRCVFVGLSFSDPNLRRWLSWEYGGRTEQRVKKGLSTKRPSHLWITKKPSGGDCTGDHAAILLEKSVEHLGVRVVWIDDYCEVGTKLHELLDAKEET